MLESSDCLFSARCRSGIEGAAWFECMSKLPDEDLIRMAYESQDFREGMDAFLTKRAPVWSGR